MAVRNSGQSGSYLSRSTVFNHNAAYTWLAWVRPSADTNAFSHYIHVGGPNFYDGNTDFIGTDTDGTTFRWGCAGGASNTFSTSADQMVAGSEYWVALVRESATSLKVYRAAGAGDFSLIATLTNDVTSRTAASNMQALSYNAAPQDGRLGHSRVWTAALTLSELNAEKRRSRALRTSNLWQDTPMVGATLANCLIDFSGNGRDWTANGTLTVEASPVLYLSDPFTVGSDTALELYPAGSPLYQNIFGGTGLTVYTAQGAVGPEGQDVDYQYILTDASVPTTDYEAIITTTVTGTGYSQCYVLVRGATTGGGASYSLQRNSATSWQLWKLVGGSFEAGPLATYTVSSIADGATVTAKLKVQGTNPVVLTATINGVAQTPYNDSAANRLQTGAPGIAGYYTSTDARPYGTLLEVDDLAGGSVVALVVADAGHGHTSDPITLGGVAEPAYSTRSPHVRNQRGGSDLWLNGGAEAALEADFFGPADTGNATPLTLADALHGHAADAVVLTTSQVLAVADATHGHTSDAITLATQLAITVADALHAHTADATSLSLGTGIVVADGSHAHTADAVALSTLVVLAVQEALHAHAADALALTTSTALAVADTVHAQTADALALSQAIALAVQEALHAHNADAVVLSAGLLLTVADATQAHTADNVTLSAFVSLSLQDAAHAHTADALVLSSTTALALQDATHAHAADSLVLGFNAALAVQEALHAHAVDSVVLSLDRTLGVNDSAHAHTADTLGLTSLLALVVNDAAHGHTADNLPLSTQILLAVQEASHAHTADALQLATGLLLSVQDARHDQSSDAVQLVFGTGLAPQDSLHAHTAGSVELVLGIGLVVSSAVHAQLADAVSLQLAGELLVDKVTGVVLSGAVIAVSASGSTYTVALAGATIHAQLVPRVIAVVPAQ